MTIDDRPSIRKRLRFPRHLLLGGLAAGVLAACGREPAAHTPATLAMLLDTSRGPTAPRIVVVGVDSENLRVLERIPRTNDDWARLLHVSVVGSDASIAGHYSATDGMVVFEPAFPFDRGQAYSLRFDPRALPTPRSDTAIAMVTGLPRDRNVAATSIVRVVPSADTLPENALRLYIEFSSPMSKQPGVEFVHPIDDGGNEVKNAFLPLGADFWNSTHTRYTVFFDPRSVKRGIKPNEQTGHALQAGRAYALRIDSTWKDAKGLPLAHSFRREFVVGPALLAPITLTDWKVGAPKSGSREPLVVAFPRPLDHGLLQQAIGVRTKSGERIQGSIELGPKEAEWRFTPTAPWKRGDYELVVLSSLEDVSGNRIGRPFQVDEFKPVATPPATGEQKLPFRVP